MAAADLSFALSLADLADSLSLPRFRASDLKVETKPDLTPVTDADRTVERALRERVATARPGDTVLGEEEGDEGGDVRWIIDPIDGTKTFIRGVPLYGVMIGVEVKNRPAVGAVYLPALDEMLTAATGLGCWWNGRPARVSPVATLSEAAVLATSITGSQGRSEAFGRLAAAGQFTRTWGDCYGYVLVATGRAEVMLDASINAWDCAPLLPIMEEAGGHFTTWAGEATIWGKDGLATNAALHQAVLDLLRE
jgi:histidinol-phosphatase